MLGHYLGAVMNGNAEVQPVSFWFTGGISQVSAANIVKALTDVQDAPELHLAVNSIGGSFEDGLFLHQAFRVFEHRLFVYNVGVMHSAAAIAFLGAEHRFCASFSTFLCHPVRYQFSGELTLEIARDFHTQCVTGTRQMVEVLSTRSTLTKQQIETAKFSDLFLSPGEAVTAGVVQSVRTPPNHPGVKMTTIPAG